MNGEIALCTLVEADSAVLALVTSADHIQIGIVEPDDWTIKETTISFYTAVPVDKTTGYLSNDITANCRAPTEAEVKQLASAVIDAVNIVPFDGGRFYCTTNGIIPPIDKNDSYNMPLTIAVKAVRETE